MGVTISRVVARSLIGLVPLGAVGTAAAGGDQVAAALFGAGAGAIIGHTVGGPDAAVVGGIIGAAAGAAIAGPREVHYRGPHSGYGPPVYHRPPRGPVYVVPPTVVFVPSHGHGYWHEAYDAWGRPVRTWVSAPGYRRHYAPPPRPHYHRHHPRHDHRW